MIRRLAIALVVGLLGLAVTPDVSLAAEKAGAAAKVGKVQLQMLVVHATTAHSNVDPKLSGLMKYLSPFKYTGFDLLNTHSASLGSNDGASFSIVGGRDVELTLLSTDEKAVRVRVQINQEQRGKLLDTTIRVNRNGSFIVAGPKHKEGVLVLPVTAKY